MHKVGELVYYRGTLGYIQEIKEITIKNNKIYNYKVYWFNEKVEEDISTEWDDTIEGLKRNMEKYINDQSQGG